MLSAFQCRSVYSVSFRVFRVFRVFPWLQLGLTTEYTEHTERHGEERAFT